MSTVMSNSLIDRINTLTLDISAFLAISINTLLVFLIITKSPKSIGTYKHLMIYIAVFELVYAISYVIEKPDIFTYESAFLIMTNTKESLFPVWVSILLDVIFIGFYGLSISLLAIHFIYRYLAISNNDLLQSFNNWKIILWFAFPILNVAIWSYAGAGIFAATEQSDSFLSQFYQPIRANRTKIEDLYYVGPHYYMIDKDGKSYINWRAFEGTAIVLTLILLSCSTILYCGLKGYNTMKELMKATSVSQKYKNLQSQLFNALVFQTIIPIFLLHIPATLIYATIFTNSSSEVFGKILMFSVGLYPALNPLPTIFIVKSYKQAVTVLFVGFFGISIAILVATLHFIYRFLSITNNRHLKSFDSWKIILWFMIPLLNGVTFMITGGIILSADQETNRFMNQNYPILVENSTTIDDLYYMGPFFWPKCEKPSEEIYFSWKGAGGSMIVMGLISLSSSIMLYFGVKGYRSMNRLIAQTACSEKFKSVQKQLFNALVFQTLIPVFLMHLPASAIYITIFFNKSSEMFGETLSLTIAMYPALNPLPTIFIVKNYRKAVKEFFISFRNLIIGKSRGTQVSTTAFSTQMSTGISTK